MSEKSNYFPASFYYNELRLVKGITFTNREIDISACLLSGKSASTISIYLDISSKTVETHIRNITSKLGFNSRERIINFIEEHGAFSVFHKHYQHLLLEHFFLSKLQKISKLLKGQEVRCSIALDGEIDNKSELLNQLSV